MCRGRKAGKVWRFLVTINAIVYGKERRIMVTNITILYGRGARITVTINTVLYGKGGRIGSCTTRTGVPRNLCVPRARKEVWRGCCAFP